MDEPKLAIQLKELSDLVLDFDIEATGFEPPEIDLRIQSLDSALEEADDRFELTTGPVVSRTGALWLLGSHRIYCGSALDATSYDALSNGEKAAATITDPPYNVKIDGHASGKGKTSHREFEMASGEMSEAEFTGFLLQTFQRISAYCRDGALIYGLAPHARNSCGRARRQSGPAKSLNGAISSTTDKLSAIFLSFSCTGPWHATLVRPLRRF